MPNQIRKYIKNNQMPEEGATLIVGLSGGADSVVLLHILHSLGYRCIAAHCNFHLRNKESLRDEQFAANFATSLTIPFRSIDFDTKQYAAQQKISIEMAARDLRYNWFEKLRLQENADAIAIAHHQDDSIETMLINLIRGTGLKGLTGIKPVNKHIIRPLLCLSKEDIINYAAKHELDYVVDSSNLKNDFVRNKIRNQIIPMLETINPSVQEAFVRTIENLRQSDLIVQSTISRAIPSILQGNKILTDELKKFPAPETILFHILSEYGFSPDVIKDIARIPEGESGKKFYSTDYQLITSRKYFRISKKTKRDTSEYYLDQEIHHIIEPIRLKISHEVYSNNFQFGKDKNTAYFDAEQLQFPLTLRKWKTGDRFMPFGMQGYKKLSDYFNDLKWDIETKQEAWILCSGKDICWIVGHRTDNRYRINENTKKVCIIKLL